MWGVYWQQRKLGNNAGVQLFFIVEKLNQVNISLAQPVANEIVVDGSLHTFYSLLCPWIFCNASSSKVTTLEKNHPCSSEKNRRVASSRQIWEVEYTNNLSIILPAIVNDGIPLIYLQNFDMLTSCHLPMKFFLWVWTISSDTLSSESCLGRSRVRVSNPKFYQHICISPLERNGLSNSFISTGHLGRFFYSLLQNVHQFLLRTFRTNPVSMDFMDIHLR